MKTTIKKIELLLLLLIALAVNANAQFGYPHVKKADIEKFKDSKLIVVMFDDSTYNASITEAVRKYWRFTGGVEFVHDSMMKKYNKPEYSFMMFARSKKSTKIKLKLASSDDDFNGLIVTTKYRKKAKYTDILANGYCSNVILKEDWYPEMIRAVQMLNNYFDYAVQADSDKKITPSYMLNNYPSDLQTITDKNLLVELNSLAMKGKEDASFIYGNEVIEVERSEINKAIINQDPSVVYMLSVLNEKFCDKIFISAANSELMYFISGGIQDCKCGAKDLKNFKAKIDKANK